jgi:hypothetical protein
MKTLKSASLLLIAIALILILGLPVFIYRAISAKDKSNYLYSVAYGIDQLGGSILYTQPSFTVSSYTHLLSVMGSTAARRFAALIDFFFGKEHCKDAYHNEVRRDMLEAAAILDTHNECT